MYETFDHTADLGLRIRAADINSLFAEAGNALFSTIVENLEAVAPTQEVEFNIEGRENDLLLFDWLNALLYHFEANGMVFSRFNIEMRIGGLHGVGFGEPLDPARHQLNHEVKAITYHGLLVEQTADGWLAEVIVDI